MICQQCGWWDRLCHCKDLVLFSTTKDKLYHFNHQFSINEKPVEIRGKDHWQKELKKRRLIDDFTQSYKGQIKELHNKKDDYKPLDRKFIANEINRELQEKGLRDKVFKRR